MDKLPLLMPSGRREHADLLEKAQIIAKCPMLHHLAISNAEEMHIMILRNRIRVDFHVRESSGNLRKANCPTFKQQSSTFGIVVTTTLHNYVI